MLPSLSLLVCFPVICLFWISWFEIITTQFFPCAADCPGLGSSYPLPLSASLPASLVPLDLLLVYYLFIILVFVVSLLSSLNSFRWTSASLAVPISLATCNSRVPAYGPSRLPHLASFRSAGSLASANTASVLLLIADLLRLLDYIYQIYSRWGTAHWTFPSLLFCSRALFPSMYLAQTLDQSASTGLGRLIKQFCRGFKL